MRKEGWIQVTVTSNLIARLLCLLPFLVKLKGFSGYVVYVMSVMKLWLYFTLLLAEIIFKGLQTNTAGFFLRKCPQYKLTLVGRNKQVADMRLFQGLLVHLL